MTDAGKTRSTNAWAAGELQHVLDCARWKLDQHETDRAVHAARVWLLTYQWLADLAIKEKKKRWKIRPKHHYFDHTIDRLEKDHQNPCRQLQCAGEEAYLGVLKK